MPRLHHSLTSGTALKERGAARAATQGEEDRNSLVPCLVGQYWPPQFNSRSTTRTGLLLARLPRDERRAPCLATGRRRADVRVLVFVLLAQRNHLVLTTASDDLFLEP